MADNVLGREYSFFFFFSSRRRHTRCYRDWSSDVCSSDLVIFLLNAGRTRIEEKDDHGLGKRQKHCPRVGQAVDGIRFPARDERAEASVEGGTRPERGTP